MIIRPKKVMALDMETEHLRDAIPLDPALPSATEQGTEPLACVSCRARKLKCDRTKPACTRCIKVNNECVYPESRRKPTFKRRNVKELEARLAQVEDYLKEVTKNAEDDSGGSAANASTVPPDEDDTHVHEFDFAGGQQPPPQTTQDYAPGSFDMPDMSSRGGQGTTFGNGQLMGLGISETLPPFEVMEELNTIYFNVNHLFMPIIHPGRFWQSFYGGPLRKPPMSLQYAMWALASFNNPKYEEYSEIFYQRAKQYAEADEMKGTGEHFITLQHAQAYALIGAYEAKSMLFTRAAMAGAKCVRLVQMMGLDRLDGDECELPPALAPATSWVEVEERRRTFWGAYAMDAHSSIATGWPSLINSNDIITRLPASEEAFVAGTKEQSAFLDDVFSGSPYTGFAGVIVICRIFKNIMHHVHRSKPNDRPEDFLNGPFWTRHRLLDNELSSAFMFLPEKLRLPQNIREPTAMHTNLNLHASVICLHHAAIEKAEKFGHSDAVKNNSLCRLKTAAEEIVNIIKMTSHNFATFKSPLSALSLYTASTVYIYMAKEDSTDGLSSIDKANLEMIIQSMEAIGRQHDITRAFLHQTCLDVEKNGLSSVLHLPNLNKYREVSGTPACSNVPMLVRSAVGRHTEVSPVLPGRLPLGNPQGKQRPMSLKSHNPGIPRTTGPGLDCFQPVLGAITRNISARPAETITAQNNHKRKRMSPSPIPRGRVDLGMTSTQSANNIAMDMHSSVYTASTHGLGQANKSHPMQKGNFTLPDRTGSSASSSPLNRASGGTESHSDSSHTSPGIFGLGNTFEENRFDLRPFQDRISTPIWPGMEEAVFGQITDSMVNSAMAATDGSDPWGILNGDFNWVNENTTG